MTSLEQPERHKPYLSATPSFETITTASSHCVDLPLPLCFDQKEAVLASEKELVSLVDIFFSLRTTEENEQVQDIASDCSFGAEFRLGIAARRDEDSSRRDSGEDYNDRDNNSYGPIEVEQHNPGPPSLEEADFVAKEAFDRVVRFAPDPSVVTRIHSLESEILERLDNVTELSRSLIPAALLNRKKKKRRLKKMSSGGVGSSLRKRLSGKKSKEGNGDSERGREKSSPSRSRSTSRSRSHSQAVPGSPGKNGELRRAQSQDDDYENSDDDQNGRGRPGIFARIRERSRSRSRSRSRKDSANAQEMLVAVTSCKSDGYYNQKAPGSTFKLPRKAPTNLKLFHELAVGVKDAYAAVGATPHKPTEEDKKAMKPAALEGATVLWDFVGNLDFLLALVDEVAVDTVTRGALKDDATFKGLRDVIKKGNRVLEDMLVRRERKYTLFIRLVQAHDRDQIERIILWNQKVEKVVGAVTDDREGYSATESDSDNDSSSASSSSVSNRAGVFSRGRQMLPSAGRVRSRRATPTPKLRKHRGGRDGSDSSDSDGGAADDGFSTVTPHSDLSSLSDHEGENLPNGRGNGGSHPDRLKALRPKDELVDVIRGLRVEKMKNKEANVDDELAVLKPNWRPKADIPISVPKLPTEYVHRHRLMRQVVGCLLDENELQQAEDGTVQNSIITCVTSRHGDKAGNGKSTLAVAVIQTVEVRERFSDGIAWLKIGRGPLSERDIRRLYEDLYRQLIVKEGGIDESQSEDPTDRFQESFASIRTDTSEARIDKVVDRADSVRRFQGGDLDGIKEDLSRMMVQRKVLLCLDDVWRLEDAKWFIFETPSFSPKPRESPYKILITTLVPSLLGNGSCQEVFVRILSEHEAVKLLLSTAGRRPYGGRNSDVFNQSRLIVKGCGNSPLGILLVGSMLRQSNRNWNLNSPAWTGIFNQCSLNLEEAAQLRSFKKAFTRIVDMCFFTVDDTFLRIALRRCFVLYAMAFGSNDWVLSGTGVPESVLYKFFGTVLAAGPTGEEKIDPNLILSTLENLKLLQRARNMIAPATAKADNDSISETSRDDDNAEKSESDWDEVDEAPKRRVQHSFLMHDSLKVVAEIMGTRDLPAFTPIDDQFTHFTDHIAQEDTTVRCNTNSWSAPLQFLFEHLAPPKDIEASTKLIAEKVHELVAISLVGGVESAALKKKKTITEAMKTNQLPTELLRVGDKCEEFMMSFLPEHLMSAKAFSSVAELLTDSEFVRRRVFALGIMEATGRQVADIIDLRTFVVKAGRKLPSAPGSPTRGASSPVPEDEIMPDISFDMDSVVCDASRSVIDEVYKTTNNMGSSDSLGMATCLATIGETLLKCRQPRDAMLRLEEAVSIYRGLLGPYHVFTAHALHSVAKALVKLGETRVALLKFAEAARIYEQCNATLHYDSIANAQALSSLLVDIGDIRKAESMFEEVISMKRSVYGDNSIPVGKTINSYAILLAKHGRMNDALRNYELARKTYRNAPATLVMDPELEIKRDYDVTLITLNIASIYSKKGDLKRALEYYEEGVQGLNEYDAGMDNIREASGVVDDSHKASSHKHLVAALGRIGSLKLKLGDDDSALEAYLQLVDEVEEDSPIASHTEKAKAHIKCATVFRQREGEDNREKSVAHLRDALRMYKALYGPEHKDTVAINTSLKQWLAEDKA